jgi:hypothetical protein
MRTSSACAKAQGARSVNAATRDGLDERLARILARALAAELHQETAAEGEQDHGSASQLAGQDDTNAVRAGLEERNRLA